jgi:hypothetical protein
VFPHFPRVALEERIANRSSDLGQPKYFLVE